MSNKDYFLKKSSFDLGVFKTGFIKDKKDSRDYKFSDLMKKRGQLKVIKVKPKNPINLQRGTYRKASYYSSQPPLAIKEVVTKKLLSSLPSKIDHTENMSLVKSQGQLGSCVSFGAVAMKEFQERKEHEKEVLDGKKDHRKGKIYDYSEQWVYWNCKKIDEWPNSEGTDLRTVMKVLKQIGVPTEKAWPYPDDKVNIGEPKRWANLIARWATIDSYWRIYNMIELKTALMDGPFIIGVPVFREWGMPVNGIIKYPSNPSEVLGGHCICVTGYNNDTQLIKFKNSWGKYWGSLGYGYLSYRYIEDFLWSAWVAKDATVTKNMIKGTRKLIK